MQKIRIEVIDKIIKQKITNRELNFLIYISRFQDDKGNVLGIHYRDICDYFQSFRSQYEEARAKIMKRIREKINKPNLVKELTKQLQELKKEKPADFSIQTFYDVKESLAKKGIISVRQTEHGDYDITILDNDCSDIEKLNDGTIRYVNTNHRLFYSKHFFRMKANEKLLTLEFMLLTRSGQGAHTVGMDRLYEKYMDMFGLKLRAIQNYLHSLKKFFSFKLKGNNYRISAHEWITRKIKDNLESQNYKQHIGITACRREGIVKRMKQEFPKKSDSFIRGKLFRDHNFIDSVNLITQYANTYNNIGEIFLQAVQRSMTLSTEKMLHPKLIHLCIQNKL